MYRIFIVEDDAAIAQAVCEQAESWALEARCVSDFRRVAEEAAAYGPHLILLDISLPFFDGYHWCRQIRRTSRVPIIFLSSAADNMNIVMAMNMGADDFIAKPFDRNVLMAKVQALLRRTYDFAVQPPVPVCRGARLRTDVQKLEYGGASVDLTKNEYRILLCLMERAGQVVSREKLMQTLWETDSFVDENTLTVNVNRLRRKLAASGRETADAARYREMVDYYTAWVHQIKTPIAAMRLTLQPDDTPNARRLMSQLLRIEQYVDMVLMYLRLDEGTSDYVIRACDLDGIIRQSLRKFAGEFIDRRLTLHYEPLHLSVVTDEKWLGFVVEQVLSNALKYTPEGGSITIDAEAPATLCIRDTGIGITAEDLPRIFDRGYTGRNGRTYRQASGIGLYLCRRICRDLGHTITASSAAGEGTVLRLDLSRRTGPLE